MQEERGTLEEALFEKKDPGFDYFEIFQVFPGSREKKPRV